MEIKNFFDFLEKGGEKKTPIRLKLLRFPELITKEDLNVEGNLLLSYSNLTSLPDGLTVSGSLYINNTD